MLKKLLLAFLVAQCPVFVSAGAFDRIYNVKDPPYNAVGNGVNDDRAAIQQALTDAGCYAPFGGQTNGGVVYFPPGTYKIGGTLSINNPCTVLGAGTLTSTIRYANTSGDAFNVQLLVTNVGDWRPMIFRDFTLEANPGSTSTGSGIRYSGANWANGLRIENVRFGYGMTYNVRLETAAAFVITGCHFQYALEADVYVDNKSHIDAGDGVISQSWFYGGSSVFAAIYHTGGGGLKILGNKFIGYEYHYYNDVSASAAPTPHSTGILHFANNSSEVPRYANVWFDIATAGSSSAYYTTIMIQGNDFSVCGANSGLEQCNGSSPQGAVVVTHSTTAAQGITRLGLITDNIIRVIGGKTANGITFYQPPGTPTGDVSDWFVSGNLFDNLAQGIFVSPAVSRFHVGENRFINVTTRLVNGFEHFREPPHASEQPDACGNVDVAGRTALCREWVIEVQGLERHCHGTGGTLAAGEVDAIDSL